MIKKTVYFIQWTVRRLVSWTMWEEGIVSALIVIEPKLRKEVKNTRKKLLRKKLQEKIVNKKYREKCLFTFTLMHWSLNIPPTLCLILLVWSSNDNIK